MRFLHLLLLFLGLLVQTLPGFAAEDLMDQKAISLSHPNAAMRAADWDPVSAVAVGSGYSMAFQAQKAHGWLAEYYQRILVFGGDDRNGRFLGALQMKMNTGGRTHLLVYRHLDERQVVTGLSLVDRLGVQFLKLPEVQWGVPNEKRKGRRKETVEYIGLISGEAHPLKFFTPLVYGEERAKKVVNADIGPRR